MLTDYSTFIYFSFAKQNTQSTPLLTQRRKNSLETVFHQFITIFNKENIDQPKTEPTILVCTVTTFRL